ncbi:MAG: L-rhamnose/proton symporter RhaT [Mangrovibacterium sp.]
MQQLIGIIFHSIGGFSSASFYVPSYRIKKWSWQTYWITMGFVAWLVMPWVGAYFTTSGITEIFTQSPGTSLIRTYIFGILWGFGGLGAGLGLRYIGLSLGQSISLGLSAVVGTIVPAILDRKVGLLVTTVPGGIIVSGLVISVAGIVLCGYAGVIKDRILTDDQKKESVKEFSLLKGYIMAVLGGIMSGCMAIAINAGKPISAEAVSAGTATVFANTPILILALGGGFTTNFVYSMIYMIKNKSYNDYGMGISRILFRNYFMTTLSGLMWYGQFFFYGMGETKMGSFSFASWSIHMSSIIIFSNLWGLWLKEWTLVNCKTRVCLWTGIALLVISVFLIGMGNYLAGTR